jgi:hypothetical protein
MDERVGRSIIVVNGRVLEIPAHRSVVFPPLEGSLAWWKSLALLGGMLVVVGAFVGADWGSAAAIGGVLLFFAAAILSGSERYEFATAVGVAALIWTSAGISVDLRADPSLIGSSLGFVVVGAAALLTGSYGILRSRKVPPTLP